MVEELALSFDMVHQYPLYILVFSVIVVQFLLCFRACFCSCTVGFLDSLDLPHDILVVHLGSAAEVLYRAFLRADAQLFVRLPSYFVPPFVSAAWKLIPPKGCCQIQSGRKGYPPKAGGENQQVPKDEPVSAWLHS